ncbi:unnamed protein product [Ectocarpus sp. 13 AM-2016]
MDQVVQMGHVGYDYPIAVQEQQNMAYGKGASPEGSGSGATDTTPLSVKDKAAWGVSCMYACVRTFAA